MKKRVYSDPSMEIVILNGEDIICASEAKADNTTDVSQMLKNPDIEQPSE